MGIMIFFRRLLDWGFLLIVFSGIVLTSLDFMRWWDETEPSAPDQYLDYIHLARMYISAPDRPMYIQYAQIAVFIGLMVLTFLASHHVLLAILGLNRKEKP